MAEELDSPLFDEPQEVAEIEQPVEVPVEEVTEEAVAEPEPELTPEPEPVAEPARPEPGFVPLSVVLDEREKRKALEARVRQFEQQRPQQAPNPYDDPEGFAAHQQQLVEQRLTQERFAMSDMFARQQHGAEAVESAVQWAQDRAQADPAFAMSYMRQQNPIDWIVQQHKRDQTLGAIGDRPLDDFVRDYIDKNPDKFGPAPVAAAASVAAQPKPAVPPVKVPRSLATQGSGPSDVRDVATGPLAAVDAVFPL